MTVTLKYLSDDCEFEEKPVEISFVPYGVLKEADKILKMQKKLESKGPDEMAKDVQQDEEALSMIDRLFSTLAKAFKLNGHDYGVEFFEDRVDFTDALLLFFQIVNKNTTEISETVKKKKPENVTKSS